MFRIKALIVILMLVGADLSAQQECGSEWNGKKCAVAITYDDGLNVHLDHVIPVLDSLELKGTFYISGSSAKFSGRMDDWRLAADNGHELGNHGLFHPCHGKSLNRDWVNPDFDLDDYTVGRMVREIGVNNTLLKAIDGKAERTYAYPCGELMIGDVSYTDFIRDDFIAGRTTERKLNSIDEADLMKLGTFSMNGQRADEMIAIVESALQQGALLVFLFHGVGGEHGANVELSEHNKLLDFLKKNEKDIWIAPLVEIAKYMHEYKGCSYNAPIKK